jgi:hypothetical protein
VYKYMEVEGRNTYSICTEMSSLHIPKLDTVWYSVYRG